MLGVLGAIAFTLLYPRLQPAAKLGISIDRNEALTRAVEHLAPLDLQDYTERNISFGVRNSLGIYLHQHDATPDERARIEAHHPVANWAVIFRKPGTTDRYVVQMDVDGNIFTVQRTLPETAPGLSLSEDEARARALAFLAQSRGIDMAAYSQIDQQTSRLPSRTDYTFTWEDSAPILADEHYRISVTVLGDVVGAWEQEIVLPQTFLTTYQDRANRASNYEFLQFILASTTWLLGLIIFAIRFREQEVGLRRGFIVAFVVMALFIAILINTLPYSLFELMLDDSGRLSEAFLYFQLAVAVFFVTFGMFFVWVSGESLARETWPRKLRAFDGVFAQHFFFPWLGRGIMRGFSLGFMMLGVWYLGTWLLLRIVDVWPTVGIAEQQILSAYIPVGLPSATGSLGALLAVSYAFLFTTALIKKYTGRTWLAILITLPLFAIFSDVLVFFDRSWTVALSALAGILASPFFLRSGLMTVLIGAVVFIAMPSMAMLSLQETTLYNASGLAGFIVMGGLFVFGFLAWRRGTPLNELEIQPQYVAYITERERLKMELDIARRAQLQMLPQHIPTTQGLDIAAFSEPAREVGGDYFDFFPIDDQRLGVAIGDVSGKGMPAALYMTMLKGFLQSRVDATTDPEAILQHVNQKFFNSAEANVYVTLLYGLFDLETGTITFARAGHLPLVIYRPSDQRSYVLKPPGLGIGLERGDVFNRVIQQETFRLQPGDIIAMVTDGLTEGRNANDEEYGTDRLIETIQQAASENAEGILTHLRTSYEAFTTTLHAHDDLTCVVVKVQ